MGNCQLVPEDKVHQKGMCVVFLWYVCCFLQYVCCFFTIITNNEYVNMQQQIDFLYRLPHPDPQSPTA